MKHLATSEPSDARKRSSSPVIVFTSAFVAGAAYRSFDQTGEHSQAIAAPVIPAQTVVVVVNVPPDPTVTRPPLPTVEPSAQATVVHAHTPQSSR